MPGACCAAGAAAAIASEIKKLMICLEKLLY
jgi:hypothetical protein